MALSVLLGGLVDCAGGGPKVDICVVDAASHGYQCVDYPESEHFVPFSDPRDLGCTSPADTEAFLKACKDKKILLVPVCKYSPQWDDFYCLRPDGHGQFHLPLKDSDKFVCLSEIHRKRIYERCK